MILRIDPVWANTDTAASLIRVKDPRRGEYADCGSPTEAISYNVDDQILLNLNPARKQ